MNNCAVERRAATIVGLVNNDIDVIIADWMTEMVGWAQQPASAASAPSSSIPTTRSSMQA